MGEVLGTLSLTDVGATTVLVLVVLMILTDRLVTRRRLDEARADAATWRTAAERQAEVNAQFALNLGVLAGTSMSTRRLQDELHGELTTQRDPS